MNRLYSVHPHGLHCMEETTRITLFKFFCNKLKALFTNSINYHTVRIYGEILNYLCSCKVEKFTDPNGKAYSQIQYILKLYFKRNYFEKKINLLSNNIRALYSNEKKLAPNQYAIFRKNKWY